MQFVSVRQAALALLVVCTLTACGSKSKEQGATQVAAKVNEEEVTVHQLNGLLSKANIPAGGDVEATRKQALDRLVEESLLVQAAKERKLDRDPRVVQAIEAARREVIARAYLEQIASAQAKPADAAIREYYDHHPELFSERRIYSFRELAILDGGDREAAVQAHFEKGGSMEDLVASLRAENARIAANSFVKPAEQLPLDAARKLQGLKDGQVSIMRRKEGLVVLQIAASKTEPVSLDKAKGAIEQFLTNKAKSEAVAAEVKRLREAGKISYMGDFAKDAPAPKAPEAQAPATTQSGAVEGMEQGIKGLK
ncbi:EpsD family peptidyl-prolyl cis-trans isomerase [Niveibacterium sp. 24ML]|uniref:EpsD family peptidyl-prolyl cis-trans isomerase n=1 Tax=Niveibacterium sp. 24ML TaxID=2985512 RepID=UPI0022702CC2|nr:EpsD family peptidyl-prolyl cis-trans isomerase [Niveibacterium sp. 24ML]MCX9156653.1 EpsD family peptidyl-prolyl cis-trans isomerase [Niveibacterium sp. 24ML]